MEKPYEISEEDIDVMLKHLEFTDPKNATREHAKAELERLQAGMHKMALTDHERFFNNKKKLDEGDKPQ